MYYYQLGSEMTAIWPDQWLTRKFKTFYSYSKLLHSHHHRFCHPSTRTRALEDQRQNSMQPCFRTVLQHISANQKIYNFDILRLLIALYLSILLYFKNSVQWFVFIYPNSQWMLVIYKSVYTSVRLEFVVALSVCIYIKFMACVVYQNSWSSQ